jgi:hypothetical protein
MIGNRQQQRGHNEREMQQKLPHDHVVRHLFGAYFDESFQQINRGDSDQGSG